MAILGILHLSDLHFKQPDPDGLDDLAGRIANFASADMAGCSALALLVTGDIAYSGASSQYVVANAFLTAIQSRLQANPQRPHVPILVVPGNHDCNFSGSQSIRDAVMPSLMATGMADEAMVEVCESVTREFEEFRRAVGLAPDRRFPGGTVVYKVRAGDVEVSILGLNSALLSKRHEKKGDLMLPKPVVEKLSTEDFDIVALHHPLSWLESTNARDLRARLHRSSAVCVTGHEHEAAVVGSRLSGEGELYFVEGNSLFPHGDVPGGFATVILDFEKQEFEVIEYSVSGLASEVVRRDRTAKHDFLRKRDAKRGYVELAADFRASLVDAGASFRHPRKASLLAEDLFVPPDILEVEPTGQRKTSGQRFGSLVPELRSRKRILITGASKAGKTAVAKRLVLDLHESGLMPVLLSGRDIPAPSPNSLRQHLDKALTVQYGQQGPTRFRNLAIDRRAIVIDDFHGNGSAPARRWTWVRTLLEQAEHIVLFAERELRLADATLPANGSGTYLSFDHAEIQEAGHCKRQEIIRKWHDLGLDSEEVDSQGHQRRIEQAEQAVFSMVKRGLMEPYPVFICAVLQVMELGTNRPQASAGSQGYLFEALIFEALNRAVSKPADIDVCVRFCSDLAWGLYGSATRSYTRSELDGRHRAWSQDAMLTVEFGRMVKVLEKADILRERHGEYGFSYPYVFDYFLGIALVNRLSQREDDAARDEAEVRLQELCDTLHTDDAANILTFAAYKSADGTVVEAVLAAATRQFADQPLASLEEDIDFLSSLGPVGPNLELDLRAEAADNRRETYRRLDDSTSGDFEDELSTGDDESMRELQRFFSAYRTVQVLGGFMRSYPATIGGQKKLELTQSCFELMHRAMSRLLFLLKAGQVPIERGIAQLVAQLHPDAPSEQRDRMARSFFFQLAVQGTLGTLWLLASAAGMEELDPVYSRIVEARRVRSYQLAHLYIKAEHYPTFPADELIRVYEKAKKSPFARSVIRAIAWRHMYMYRTPTEVRQRMCAKLDIKAIPEFLGHPRAHEGKR